MPEDVARALFSFELRYGRLAAWQNEPAVQATSEGQKDNEETADMADYLCPKKMQEGFSLSHIFFRGESIKVKKADFVNKETVFCGINGRRPDYYYNGIV
ncbi:hypothetical protein PRIPAC_72244 [Pristionchus pacificus]|uniref:Uncharacterized protein n=1 Tax=Pristionchus pacificus TaxID=54126 RepID=A0A2A6CS49_PRIPA|nr:hypothetical protein PRIPAC_72244 [Pristionchus pacificus]|eukprot:PDM80969.1 hypothetical protein PRIPAC_35972 [Pristionchus pacificus]